MKTKYLILLAAAVMTFASSCRKDEHCTYKIVNITVPQNTWKYTEKADNNYFIAEIDLPEVTEAAFDGGILNIYRTFNYDKTNASQQILPSVRLIEEVLEDKSKARYTETIDYEYGIGWLNLYYTLSDFIYDETNKYDPGEMTFRVVLVY